MNNEQYKYAAFEHRNFQLLIVTVFTVHCGISRIFGRSAEIRTRGPLNPIQACRWLSNLIQPYLIPWNPLYCSGLGVLFCLNIRKPLRGKEYISNSFC